jgi:molybdopterin converting factor small subunit
MEQLYFDESDFLNETEDTFQSVVTQDEAVKKLVAVLATQNRGMLSWFRGRGSELYSGISIHTVVRENGIYADAFCSEKISKLIAELPQHLFLEYAKLQKQIRGTAISVSTVDVEAVNELDDKLAKTVEKVKGAGDRSEAVADLERQIVTMLENIRNKVNTMKAQYTEDSDHQASEDDVSAHMRYERFEAATNLEAMFTTFRDIKEKLGVAFPDFMSMMSTVLYAAKMGLWVRRLSISFSIKSKLSWLFCGSWMHHS